MSIKVFSKQVRSYLSSEEWFIVEDSYNPLKNNVYESLFCLASGYMSSRGSHEEGDASKSLPATYIHGVFDKSEAFQRELVNTPDWAKLKIYHECAQIGVESGESLDQYIRVLDLRNGILAKHYITTDSKGRKTQVETIKFLSRHTPHVGLFRVYITPMNYEGILEFENIIDGNVTNFIDFPRFRVKHFETLSIKEIPDVGCSYISQTRDFFLPIATTTAVTIQDQSGNNILKSRKFRKFGEQACEFLDVEIAKNQTVVVDKYASIKTGRESCAVEYDAIQDLKQVVGIGFDTELHNHIQQYQRLWDAGDVTIGGDPKLQKAVRFNIFHLMSTPSISDDTVNIGAKLMHGEEYGGHAFWDTELFILPFFSLVFPEVAKNLVSYRYNLLNAARNNAHSNGFKGAQYPWESADTGEEECPAWTIEPDGSCYRCYVADYEHHVTAAVAFGVVRYYRCTKDRDFLFTKGIEILLETARFWISRLEYNKDTDTYYITSVTGPDEWHEPVDNNAYTNYLARWNIRTALQYLYIFQDEEPVQYKSLMDRIQLTEQEYGSWRDTSNKIYIPQSSRSSGIIEQFEGYFNLKHATITEWNDLNMPIRPKELEGYKKDEVCILKQADVVMLMFLLEHDFDIVTQKKNFNYYEQRTLHRSSLSASIHCMVGLRVHESERAYSYLERSAYVDIDNKLGNTREGIHAASAGGTWQSVVLGYGGVSIGRDNMLEFSPRIPEKWTYLEFSLVWKGTPIKVFMDNREVRVALKENCGSIQYRYNGQVYTIEGQHEISSI